MRQKCRKMVQVGLSNHAYLSKETKRNKGKNKPLVQPELFFLLEKTFLVERLFYCFMRTHN